MDKKELLELFRKNDWPEHIVNAFAKVPRENFVPETQRDFAYEDTAYFIGYGQTTSQPYTIAVMFDLLDLEEGQKVLEIGSGSGYVLALISEITKRKVFGVERIKELTEMSKRNLKGYNAEVYNRNGINGLKEESPFERILISAAIKEIPKTILEQLTDDGILVAPVGSKYECTMFKIRKDKNEYLIEQKIPSFAFVDFVGE